LNIDLSAMTSASAKGLIKADGENILKSLTVKFTRTADYTQKAFNHVLLVHKNSKQLIRLENKFAGDLARLSQELKENDGELAAIEFSGSSSLQVLDYLGTMSGKLVLEASRSSRKHYLNFEFDSDNIFRLMTKLKSVRAKFDAKDSTINANLEISRLGDQQTLVLKAQNAAIRDSIESGKREFDVQYSKTMANGDVSAAKGTVVYKFESFKNYQVRINVPDKFFYENLVSNKRNDDLSLGTHELKVTLAHLDYLPMARHIHIRVENTTIDPVRNAHTRNMNGRFLVKEATSLSALNDQQQLKYIVDIDLHNKFYFPGGKSNTVITIKKFC
jgi:hypothetical protein